MLRSTAEALVLTLFIGVPLDVWGAFWLVYEDNGEAVRDAFLAIYGLEIATIDTGEPPTPLDVVRPNDLPFWVDASLFILTPAAACLSGCEQSTVPTP